MDASRLLHASECVSESVIAHLLTHQKEWRERLYFKEKGPKNISIKVYKSRELRFSSEDEWVYTEYRTER